MPNIYRLKPNEEIPVITKQRIDPRIDLAPENPAVRKERVTLDAPFDFEDTNWVDIFGSPSPEMLQIQDDNMQQDVSNQMAAVAEEPPEPSTIDLPKQVSFEDDA
jgi:hypothetical protein